MKHVIQLFPTLIFSEEVFSGLISGKPDEKRKMAEALAYLDTFGLNKSFLGRRFKGNRGDNELIVRLNKQSEVVFTVKSVEEESFKYEVATLVWR